MSYKQECNVAVSNREEAEILLKELRGVRPILEYSPKGYHVKYSLEIVGIPDGE